MVPIRPLDRDRVVADQLDAKRLDILWHYGGMTPLAGDFIDASRARTVLAQQAGRIEALVSVLPFYRDIEEICPSDLDWRGRLRVRHQKGYKLQAARQKVQGTRKS